jgi:DNA repair exonuclease SbcCD nuclease subunit
MIILLSDFLNNLADIGPTLVIAGNHDANLNNPDRMDAIYPIIENLKHKNLIYLKHSGLYKMANITFSVMGVFEKKEKYKRADAISDNSTKIAIYHGPVNNSITDTGHVIVNDKMEISFFDGFDIVLLGDIHKRQNLQEYEIEVMMIDDSELDDYLEKGWQLEK